MLVVLLYINHLSIFMIHVLQLVVLNIFFFFFFQAEDGIRDLIVTGVQTCALPISLRELRNRPAAARGCPARGGRGHRAGPGARAAAARGVSRADRAALRAGVRVVPGGVTGTRNVERGSRNRHSSSAFPLPRSAFHR